MNSEEATETLKEALTWEDPFNVILAIIETISETEISNLLRKEEILAIHTNLLDSQVYNGGFHQFFFNYSGDHALNILESLREIGSQHIFSLLERALTVFPNFDDFQERNTRADYVLGMQPEILEFWKELSEEYFHSSEYIYGMVVGYIRRLYNL